MRLPPEREADYPKLFESGYTQTSDVDANYNCAAWVNHETRLWYESSGEVGMYWPEEVPKGYYVENFVRLFAYFGYVLCDSSELEPGFVKIAIYRFIREVCT